MALLSAPACARGLLSLTLLPMMFALTNVAGAQEKVIEKAPVHQSDPSSGHAMYVSYCAACHGPDGKGNGPAASEFKVPPTDLTLLAKKNHGEFPSDHVWAVLHFGTKARAHGTSTMPVWGDLLHSLDPSDSSKEELRIANLVSYLKTLQAK
jgi:mono/diheme cytochrome c family protein